MCDCEPKPEVVSLIVKNERERIASALDLLAMERERERVLASPWHTLRDAARLLREARL